MQLSYAAPNEASLVLRIALFGLLISRRRMGIPLVTELWNWRKSILQRSQRENNIVVDWKWYGPVFCKCSRYYQGANCIQVQALSGAQATRRCVHFRTHCG